MPEKIELVHVFLGSHYHQVAYTGQETVESIAALDSDEKLAAFNADRPEWNHVVQHDVWVCRILLGLPTPDLPEDINPENVKYNWRFNRTSILLYKEFEKRPVQRLIARHALRNDWDKERASKLVAGAKLPFGSLANVISADVVEVVRLGFDYAALGRVVTTLGPDEHFHPQFDALADVEIVSQENRFTVITPTSQTRITVRYRHEQQFELVVELDGSASRAAQIVAFWKESGFEKEIEIIHKV